MVFLSYINRLDAKNLYFSLSIYLSLPVRPQALFPSSDSLPGALCFRFFSPLPSDRNSTGPCQTERGTRPLPLVFVHFGPAGSGEIPFRTRGLTYSLWGSYRAPSALTSPGGFDPDRFPADWSK
uniref:Uncharacterized protein n=1 Tax=Treubia lacunosa TaxID=93845 RepID=G4Y9Q2_9MARC|nr:hypothetical protein TrlaMp03 [Treubia lacunosa]AEH99698.1 hypothetical protein TrlaMp03 [Treubia lacunosa]